MDVAAGQHEAWDDRVPPIWAGVRGLILGWCLWLLGSWATTLWISATAPAVRWMVYAAMVGMLLVWPAFRLSQTRRRASSAFPEPMPLIGTLGDWLSLNLVLQAVVWPLQLIAQWSLTQTLWLIAALAAWSALIGVFIALGRCRRAASARTAAMLACVAVVLGESMLRVLIETTGRSVGDWRLSPIGPLWELTAKREQFALAELPLTIALTAAAALLGWVLLAGSRYLPRAH